ncbi:TetR/AcrR family transcriptional regulator [Agromyces sp. H66]|uniref:TetR/AcrR family transcriptional regulator n=1 Tax=Agromyces sp. H66 TaxID=2529859 RepID=UPI0010A9BA4A|nr:TetR/AcrR family transcriptional regulator [Agromyces sp. H66]
MPEPTAAASVTEGASARKHRAILAAAEEMFLRAGYLGTNMDELAALSQVSKQTVYKHFGSKEALFVELVTTMTDAAGDRVHNEVADPPDATAVPAYLRNYAERQLDVVMTPRLLQLRRLVIGEVGRFPELARALYESGPGRAMASLAAVFGRLGERGLLAIDDPEVAAAQFNWLVMAGPLNEAMLLGDEAVPDASARRRHVAETVRLFLAGYGPSA